MIFTFLKLLIWVIILSFSVTYYVYRVMLQVEQVPIIMLLGIFVIIGIPLLIVLGVLLLVLLSTGVLSAT